MMFHNGRLDQMPPKWFKTHKKYIMYDADGGDFNKKLIKVHFDPDWIKRMLSSAVMVCLTHKPDLYKGSRHIRRVPLDRI